MAINPKPHLRVIQVGFVEEPASATFSFLILVLIVCMARNYVRGLSLRSFSC